SYNTASALGMLAGLYAQEGKAGIAVPLYERMLGIKLDEAQLILPGISEAEGIEFIRDLYATRDLLLAASCASPPRDPTTLYRSICRTRSLVSQAVQQRNQFATTNSEVRRLVENLQATRRLLATATLAQPSAGESLDSRQKAIDELTEEKERL